VSAFLGMTAANLAGRDDVFWIRWDTDEDSWKLGDRGLYCYAGARRPVTGTLRNLGSRRV
jgi:hypothetical protein